MISSIPPCTYAYVRPSARPPVNPASPVVHPPLGAAPPHGRCVCECILPWPARWLGHEPDIKYRACAEHPGPAPPAHLPWRARARTPTCTRTASKHRWAAESPGHPCGNLGRANSPSSSPQLIFPVVPLCAGGEGRRQPCSGESGEKACAPLHKASSTQAHTDTSRSESTTSSSSSPPPSTSTAFTTCCTMARGQRPQRRSSKVALISGAAVLLAVALAQPARADGKAGARRGAHGDSGLLREECSVGEGGVQLQRALTETSATK